MNTLAAMRMTCGLVLGVAFMTAPVSATVFPTVGGDISSAAAWGGSVPEDAEINAGGTYTVSANTTFNKMVISGGNNTFTQSDGVRVCFTNEAIQADGSFKTTNNAFYLTDGASDTVQTFSGGIWDFSGCAYLGVCRYGRSTGGPTGAQLLFKDGAVVTNVGALSVTGPYSNPAGSRITVTGPGTRLHLRKETQLLSTAFKVGNAGDAQNVKGRLEILNGAEFYTGTACYFDSNASKLHSQDMEFLVSGAGSKATFAGALYLGWGWNVGNRVVFDDQATGVFKSVFDIGYGAMTSPAVSNVVSVKNGSTVTSANTVWIGAATVSTKQALSYGNRLEVLSGSTFTSPGIYANYASASVGSSSRYSDNYGLGDGTHDNGILVSNATLTTSGAVSLGYGSFTYKGWLEAYDNAALSFSALHIGGFYNSDIAVTTAGTNGFNRAYIADSTLTLNGGAGICYVGASAASCSNSLDIVRSTVKAKKFAVGVGHDTQGNRVTIADSTMTASGDACTLMVGQRARTIGNCLTLTNTMVTAPSYNIRVPELAATAAGSVSNAVVLQEATLTATSTTDNNLYLGSAPGGSYASGFTAYRSTLPPFKSLYLGGTNSTATFIDTPLTVTSTLSGVGYNTTSEGSSLICRGAESVLTLPSGEWVWGKTGASGATLSIEEGATLMPSSTNVVINVGAVGTERNKLRIAGGKLDCQQVRLLGNGTEFEISGVASDVKLRRTRQTYPIFLTGSNCVYRLTNGARLEPMSYNFYFCFWNNTVSHHNSIVVEKNACLDLAKCVDDKGNSSRYLMFGYWGASPHTNIYNNALLVTSGGVVTNVSAMMLGYTHNNQLIIDGGSVYCDWLTSPYNTTSGYGTNSAVVIRGPGSKLVVKTDFKRVTAEQDTVRFEVPAEGYDEAPIQSSYFGLESGTKLEVDLSAILPTLKKKGKTMTLARAPTMSVAADVLAAAKASVSEQLLAANCTGYLTLDSTTLKLHVAPAYGTAILLR